MYYSIFGKCIDLWKKSRIDQIILYALKNMTETPTILINPMLNYVYEQLLKAHFNDCIIK